MMGRLIAEESSARTKKYCTMIGGSYDGMILELHDRISVMAVSKENSAEELYRRRCDNPLYFDFVMKVS